MTAESLTDPAGPQPCLQHVTLNPGSQRRPDKYSRFLEGPAVASRETPGLLSTVGSRDPVALEDRTGGMVWIGGHLTSRCWQKGTGSGSISQMGDES